MSRVEAVSAWEQTVSSHLPHLSRPQAAVLALWSYGVVLAPRCGQTSVVAVLAPLLGQREGTVRQRLREWLYAAADKRGSKRRAVAVETCFAPLLGWVLRGWQGAARRPPRAHGRLALARDATYLGDRFGVLAVAVLYRSGAIPVAWAVLPATQPGAWRPHWEGTGRGSWPGSRPVCRRAGACWCWRTAASTRPLRALYAPWLFGAIVRLGGHPGLRPAACG